jgi:hypothetical protein
MMSHHLFRTGHALSFNDQPYLDSLFAQVSKLDQPLTIVVGAGVSMNAGLRSWSDLISYMADQIEDKAIRALAKKASGDLARRAELIVQLILKSDPSRAEATIIRQALYSKGADASTGGQLAQSIARLVAARGSKTVKLLTTNFDTGLEGALSLYFPKEKIKTFALPDAEEWAGLRETGEVGVLHVHGVVPHPEQEAAQGPLVLTESQFLRHGKDVRQAIYENLKDSCALFVGLSMSDPNLIGPMYEMQLNGEKAPLFNVLVPDPFKDTDDDVACRYVFESAEFMENALKLKTIFMKSYSQLNQVVSDLSLAIVEPRYRARRVAKARSLVYGHRILRVIDTSYQRIGCAPGEEVPVGPTAETLNARLHLALHDRRKGPLAVLKKVGRAQGGGHLFGGVDGENFALSLWLRCRRSGSRDAKYAINLVGTSAFTHREGWSVRPAEEIRRDSQLSAAQAIFRGAMIVSNAESVPASPIWRGIVASPIVLEGMSSDQKIGKKAADVLTVGAITLNSNRVINLGSAGAEESSCSILSKVDARYMNDLAVSLQWVAWRLLKPEGVR